MKIVFGNIQNYKIGGWGCYGSDTFLPTYDHILKINNKISGCFHNKYVLNVLYYKPINILCIQISV